MRVKENPENISPSTCYYSRTTQVEKMRAELPNLNHCAVPFLSRAAVNLSWYDSTTIFSLSAFQPFSYENLIFGWSRRCSSITLPSFS